MHNVEGWPDAVDENLNGPGEGSRVRGPSHDETAVRVRLAEAVDLSGVAELAHLVLGGAAGEENAVMRVGVVCVVVVPCPPVDEIVPGTSASLEISHDEKPFPIFKNPSTIEE